MGVKIAIGGKGGVGKTTVCAIWAKLFSEDGLDVIAIDADSSVSLSLAFGIPFEKSPKPLIEMKELIGERSGSTSLTTGGTGKNAVGAYFRLNPKVSDLPEQFWLDLGRVKLLVLGAITQAGAGCACAEGAFLKALLTHTILQRQEVVLVDLAAGVECMGRASVQGIDAMVVVVEPGARSIETANSVAAMAKELGIKTVGVIGNKITDKSQIDVIKSGLAKQNAAVWLGALPYSKTLQQADLKREPVIDADKKVVEELTKAKNKLMELIPSKRD